MYVFMPTCLCLYMYEFIRAHVYENMHEHVYVCAFMNAICLHMRTPIILVFSFSTQSLRKIPEALKQISIFCTDEEDFKTQIWTEFGDQVKGIPIVEEDGIFPFF